MRKAKSDDIAMLAEATGSPDPLSFAQEIDMIIEGALITHEVAPDSNVCTIARRAAMTLMEKHLPAVV